MSRLVDPVHLFNAAGLSVLTEAHLNRRIKELEEELAKEKSRVRLLTKRLTEQGADPN